MSGTLRARFAGLCVIAGVSLLGVAASAPSVGAANVALTGWTQQGGDANWQVQPAGDSVYVVAPSPDFDNSNGPASFFVSPANVSGTFRVSMAADPEPAGEEGDYMGFALGYSAPVANEPCSNAALCNTGFYLFDWKKDTELEGGTALDPSEGGQEGFSLMRVEGNRDLQNNNTPDHPACLWTHENIADFCEVVGTDFGATKGYEFGVTYTFLVTYSGSFLSIVLEGTGGAANQTLFTLTLPGGTVPSGRLAFYNYSQPNVEYAFDNGTTPATTTTLAAAPTTAPGSPATTSNPAVGPATRTRIVRTGLDDLATQLQLLGGAALLMVGAVLTATRGKRPEGDHFRQV